MAGDLVLNLLPVLNPDSATFCVTFEKLHDSSGDWFPYLCFGNNNTGLLCPGQGKH